VTEEKELVNRAFRVILLGVEDVVGKNGMAAVLRAAKLPQYIDNYPPSDTENGGHAVHYLSNINHALYDIYGARGARAILNRIGRGRARKAIEENATFANATRAATMLLPRRMRIKLSLEKVSKEYSHQMGTSIKISEDAESIYWEDPLCSSCLDWKSETPVCYTNAGFIFGILSWGLGDDDLQIQEVTCRAKGDAVCKYRVVINA
jgi:predicted hydrocarbon binding protein